jgi:hypothetical protein
MAELQRFVYRPRGHEGDEVGYCPPVLDMHQRPLVNPEIVHPDNPRATRRIVAGQIFATDDPHEAEFYRMHSSFKRSF